MPSREPWVGRQVPVRAETVRVQDQQRALRPCKRYFLHFAQRMSDCAVVRDEVPTARRAFDPCNDITDAREASAPLRRDELGHGNSRPSRASQCPMTRLYEIDGAFLCARGQRFYSCPCRLMRFE